MRFFCCSSKYPLVSSLRVCRFCEQLRIVTSSVKNIVTSDFILFIEYFMYGMSNTGHSIDLCGTPCFTILLQDLLSLQSIIWNLFLKKDFITFCVWHRMPLYFNLISNFAPSNAFVNSKCLLSRLILYFVFSFLTTLRIFDGLFCLDT